jgi:drug/metabolite transporter (DMT)-like permease
LVKVRADGLLGLHSAVVLFALAGIIGKTLILAPAILVAGRSAFAAVTLLAVIALQRQLHRLPYSRIIMLSGIVLAVHWVTFFQAIDSGGVSVALVSYSTYPLALLLIETCWYHTAPSLIRVVAGGLILVGMVLLVPALDLSNHTAVGALWGIGSGALFALYTLVNRGLADDEKPIAIACSQNAISALCMLPFAAWCTTTMTHDFGLRDVALLALLGAVCTGLAHTWFIASLSRVGAGTASLVASLEAVYGVALAWVLVGEVPALRTVLGGIIILSAVILGTRSSARAVPRDGDGPPLPGAAHPPG